MADKIYPSAKPKPQPPQTLNGGGSAAGAPPAFPATKSQMYQRPMYRPNPAKSRRRSSGSCFRCCCCWLLLFIVLLILLVAIAGGVFYLLYRPHRPAFSVSSVRLSALNLTSSNTLTSSLDLSITARNPNKKIVYLYDDFSLTVSSNGVDVGDGSIPGFRHDAKNTTVLKTTASTAGESVDPAAAPDLKKGGSIPLTVDLETKAGVKVGGLKTKKIGIKVHCEGFQATAPVKGKAKAASAMDVPCTVKLRVKIWKWTF